ncbi:Hin recombinase, partial [Salmonella enterica subsp. enterica serovar Bareilly]|nr:Hin recombinase [Salmonella enterica subsp. enterica serovar Bareilly]
MAIIRAVCSVHFRAGLAAARAQGRVGGRRPKLTPEQWEQAGRLLAAGESCHRVG